MLRTLAVATALVFLATGLHGQSIITVAGGGTDDGRPATAASIYAPSTLVFDSEGNLIVADFFSHRVRRISATRGTIVTIAGTGTRGFSGDGGPATLAQLDRPSGLAFDSRGALFIAEGGFFDTSGQVRRVSSDGIITTYAGSGSLQGDGGPATAAFLIRPSGIVFDAAGNLFITERFGHRVRRVDAASGIITTVAGNGVAGSMGDGGAATAAQLNEPVAITFDAAGNLFIAERANHRIRRVDIATGVITTVVGDGIRDFSGDGGPAVAARIGEPRALVFDDEGSLYIADAYSNRVRRVDQQGIITTIAGKGPLGFLGLVANVGDGGPATAATLNIPNALLFDDRGNLLISDASNFRVRRVDKATSAITTIAGNGLFGYSGDGSPATATVLSFPFAPAIDAAGNLYFGDEGSDRVLKVDAATRLVSTIAGGAFAGSEEDEGGPATEAGLFGPSGVALDGRGALYIADRFYHRIRKVNLLTGIFTTVAGSGPFELGQTSGSYGGDGGPATQANLNEPISLALDAAANIYVADSQNSRIRRIDSATGIITTVAGNGTRGFSGDGGPATQAALDRPLGVAFDVDGNLLITDTRNQRLRRVDRSGIIVTIAGTGAPESKGDGGPATLAAFNDPEQVAVGPDGTIYVAETFGNRIRMIRNGIITTFAGNGRFDASGDGGPATAAGLNGPYAVSVDAQGTVYIGGSGGIRAVPLCTTVAVPALDLPSDGALSVPTTRKLSWNPVRGAFRYDLLLDTVDPPQRAVTTDLAVTTFTATLLPGRRYFWRVIAKGDPFCPAPSSAPSPVRSFTTKEECGPAVVN